MDKDIRWQQRFENLSKALERLREALNGTEQDPDNHLYQIALNVLKQLQDYFADYKSLHLWFSSDGP